MNAYLIVFIILIITVFLVVGFIALAPAVVEIHKTSMAPITGLVGNPDAVKTVAAFI